MAKQKQLFDFLNGIYQDQRSEFYDELTDAEKKGYKNSRYMLHRFMSMNPHYLPVVNAIQPYTKIPDRNHYLFFTSLLPKGRQFNKYIKNKKETKYEKWLVELVSKHFGVSNKEAVEYIELYYKDSKDDLKKICQMYGIEKKLLKKAKLL